jgi:hypothetical protein
MTNSLHEKYNELFKINLVRDWCQHKKELWKLITQHIDTLYSAAAKPSVNKVDVINFVDEYFKATNFAYAYYEPQQGEPVLFIAKSKDAKNYINAQGDLKSILESFYSELKIKFCFQKYDNSQFKYHRVDEDLSFREISGDYTNPFIASQQTCCERMIFENLVWHIYGRQSLQEGFLLQLSGKIKIYTEFEPCIRCYGLMKYIEENHNLDIKVYYNEWVPNELQFLADVTSITNLVDAFPEDAFDETGEFKKGIFEKISDKFFKEGLPLKTAYARVAKEIYNQNKAKCDYKSN